MRRRWSTLAVTLTPRSRLLLPLARLFGALACFAACGGSARVEGADFGDGGPSRPPKRDAATRDAGARLGAQDGGAACTSDADCASSDPCVHAVCIVTVAEGLASGTCSRGPVDAASCRATHLDAAAEAAPERDAAGSCEPRTTPSRVAVGPTTEGWIPGGLAARDGVVYAGFGHGEYSTAGIIYSVPASGGALTPFVATGYFGTLLSIDDSFLYFAEGAVADDGGMMTTSYVGVVAAALGTGATQSLTAPLGALSMLGNDDPGVYWVASEGTGVTHWNPKGGGAITLTLATEPGDVFGPVVDDERAYWWQSSNGTVQFESKPLSGGATSVFQTFAATTQPLFIGVDATNLYFAMIDYEGSNLPATVEKVPKAGGAITQLFTTNAYLFYLAGGSIYVVSYTSQDTLQRASTAGGELVAVASSPGRYVFGLTADSCNLYYSLVNPMEVWAVGLAVGP